MRIHIDDELIEEIHNKVDLVELISEYVGLERSGSNFLGLCPFHNEKTPSFSVSQTKQFYHCFGCGAGGDSIEFIMAKENLAFPEAVRFLAEKYSIGFKELGEEEKEKISLKNRSYEINRQAAAFFLNKLDGNQQARNYLEARSIDRGLSRKFGLGYAEDSWDSLQKHLLAKGYKIEELEALGLVGKSSKGYGYFDKFRNRIIFPIIDTRSRVIGFGGRVLDDSMPKYLNSQETLVFNKGNNLYGLNMLERYSKRKDIILVEGYMDVISMFKNGIDSSVASLGTALTKRQAELLKRYGRDVYICYDSDLAGIKATNKAIGILLSVGIKPRIIDLAGYKDPDDFFMENRQGDFETLIKEALHFMDYKIKVNRKKYDLTNIDEKIRFTIELAQDIKFLKNPIEKDVYIKKLSEDLNIARDAIEKEVYKTSAPRRDREFKEARQPSQEIKTILPSAGLVAEIEIIRLMLYDKDLYNGFMEEKIHLYFESPTVVQALKYIEEKYRSEDFIDKNEFYDIMESVPNVDMAIVNKIIDNEIKISTDDMDKFISDLIRTLEINRLEKRKGLVREEIEKLDELSAEIRVDKSSELLRELTKLNEELTKLRYEN